MGRYIKNLADGTVDYLRENDMKAGGTSEELWDKFKDGIRVTISKFHHLLFFKFQVWMKLNSVITGRAPF
jgi:hypothetical protein